MSKHKLFSLLALAGMLAAMFVSTPLRSTAQGSRTFPETGKTVSGQFLEYWDTNGGLAQ